MGKEILKKLSAFEICQLRLRCVEPYITVASRYDLNRDDILKYAQKSWDFMLEATKDYEEDNPKKGPSSK